MTPDGKHECDRCGVDVGNGGVAAALIVSDLDPDRPGMIRNLHYCRDRSEGEGEQRHTVKGCTHKILHPATTKAYDARKKAEADRG